MNVWAALDLCAYLVYYNCQMLNQNGNSQRRLLSIQPSQTTELTDYQNDPHIYNNVWQYIFSIVGLTVGFGSFWRFPYLIYKNGGGVFLVPYFISMFVVGVPLLYLETAVGQMHRVSIPFVLKRIHPSLKMIGVAFLLNSLHLCSVYNVLLTYSYRFIFTAFNFELPFAAEPITQNTYFRETILHQSQSINHFEAINPFLFVLYVVSLLICHFIVKNGVKSSGKIVTVTATAPFFLLLILLVRGLFLSGAKEGLEYLFEPKWQKIWEGEVWSDAIVQVFYQTGVGMGTLYCVSCLNPRRQDLLKGVLYVPIGLIICGFFSAITIFVYLSHFCQTMGLSINDPNIKLSGPELSFNVLPKALVMLPMANLWIFVFFVTMVFLGIDSQFGMIEALYTYLRDEFKSGSVQIMGVDISPESGKYIVLLLIMLGCPSLTSNAGIYYLQFYDYFISNIPFMLAAVVEVYLFVYLFKFQELEKVIVRYTGKPTPFIIRFFLESKLLVALLGFSLVVGVVEQLGMYRKYSIDFYLLGWAITLYPGILSYLYFRRRWTGWQELRLTFHDIEHPVTYL